MNDTNKNSVNFNPFLSDLAYHVLSKYDTQITDLHVILPTRRSCMYFRHYLLQQTTKTVLAPQIWSMDDFVLNTTPLEIIDSVRLLFRLFETYKKFDQNQAHNLEKFAPLGTIILRDFDGIDKNMINGDQLFDYLNEVKALERWRKTLGKDVLDLSQDSTITEYYQFWSFLKQTYIEFRQQLLEQKMGYLGLAFHYMAKNLDQIIENQGIEKIIFAGFNQLTHSELMIIQQFRQKKQAEIFWDIDEFYFTNPLHEAGFDLRKNIAKIQKGKNIDDIKNNISQVSKNIEIIRVSDKVTQAKLAGDILTKNLEHIHTKDQIMSFKKCINHTAILLPDETMLMPLLYSLPIEKSSEAKRHFSLKEAINVTAGLTMDKTPLFYLIDNLFLMQENLKRESDGRVYVYHKDIIRLLRHPFIQYSKKYNVDYQLIQMQIEKIQQGNLIYISMDQLLEFGKETSFYSTIFRDWKNQLTNALDALESLVNVLSDLFDNKHNVLENEYLYLFYTLLTQLRTELTPYAHTLNLRVFKHFLYEIIKHKRVPFTGEPLAPIQIMGMLESRTLDFENLIIMSCNESILPKGKIINSLIPIDLRRTFNLPTHLETDATEAYTFYRLFHQAKNIYLIYSTASHGVGGTEKSRFLTQVIAELGKLECVSVTEKQLIMPLPENKVTHFEVDKEPLLLRKVEHYLNKGITPSFVNMYIRSPLEFFQRKILKLREPDDIEEDMMVNTFGTVIHEFLDQKFQPYIGKEVTEQIIKSVYENENQMLQEIEHLITKFRGGMITTSGKNYILKYVARYLINTFLELQVEKESPYYLVNQENTMSHTLSIKLADGRSCQVRLWGKADRIDIIGDKIIRVVDYKTGTYHEKDLRAKELKDLFLNPSKGKIIQLLIYKYLLIKNLQINKIQHLPRYFNISHALTAHQKYIKSGFFFFRKLFDGFKEYKVTEEPQDTNDFLLFVEQFMTILVDDMLDQNLPFRRQSSEFGFEVMDVNE